MKTIGGNIMLVMLVLLLILSSFIVMWFILRVDNHRCGGANEVDLFFEEEEDLILLDVLAEECEPEQTSDMSSD